VTDRTRQLADGLRDTYVLERLLGDGGMSTVWLAKDLKHDRPVALKVLKPELARNLGAERFRREVTTAARLQHPHILTVHDSGETGGLFWFTMPYVEGESVRERLVRDGRFPVAEALRIVREAAQALQHAHGQGIVHRDVKPENLLLTKDGSTLVADFGLARIVGSDAAGAAQLTQVGMAVGTPAYMSPEQAMGDENVDARADQYGLAVTLYEMLSGEPPFSGRTTSALMASRFSGPPPGVRARRADVPVHVEMAMQRALAVKPAERFPSMQAFAEALAGKDAAFRVSRRAVALGAAAVVTLAAAGAWMAARRPAAVPPETPGRARLAVLPFENLGDTADAYFADGLSDELRGKLTSVPGLEVIARASSVAYRGSAKAPQEIARELGVRYLLTGTVRWEKRADGPGRVRVSPELIEVVPDGAPATKWQQPFDAPLTDVFQVQSGIAGQVATALDVALGAGEQRTLAAQPTQDLRAYDAFLRGEAAWGNANSQSPESLRRAQALFEEAVRRDPAFGPAWARLAHAHLLLYSNVAPEPRDAAAARAAIARATALAPDAPETVIAKAFHERYIDRDFPKAIATLRAGLVHSPANAELVSALGWVERLTGDTGSARAHLTQAQALDPRSALAAARLAAYLTRLRDYPAARATAERAYALGQDVGNMHDLAVVALAEGDLPRARAIVREGIGRFGRDAVTSYVSLYYDTWWALEPDDQRHVTTLGPGHFGDARAAWALAMAQVHHHLGDAARARAYADTARIEYARQIAGAPGDQQAHALHGLALAYLGRGAEAVAAGERGMRLAPIAQDAWTGPYIQQQLVRIHLLLGNRAQALDLLEPLLRVPDLLSPGWLRVDPGFDALRGDPRFEALTTTR
jgi:serine/threonine-protein kinase